MKKSASEPERGDRDWAPAGLSEPDEGLAGALRRDAELRAGSPSPRLLGS
jgi:hypothetical protein